MNSRPKNTDTMDDVLEMQNEYLRKKHEENLQPAAQVIRNPAGELESDGVRSLDYFLVIVQ